jgi:hypothetical protein
MPYRARVLTVLIASPGDVKTEWEAIAEELDDWNRQHQYSKDRIRLEARRYELDAVPEMGSGDVQSVINRQIVDDADIVIAVFHSRLGTPTPRAASGTAEEIDRTVRLGKPVHVYFSDKRVPKRHDAEQLRSVLEFQRQLSARGYAGSFTSISHLKKQIRRAIEMDVDKFKDQNDVKGAQASSTSRRHPAPAPTTDPMPAKRTRKIDDRSLPLEISYSSDLFGVSLHGLGNRGYILLKNTGRDPISNITAKLRINEPFKPSRLELLFGPSEIPPNEVGRYNFMAALEFLHQPTDPPPGTHDLLLDFFMADAHHKEAFPVEVGFL